MLRNRILAAATAAVLMLGMSVGGAGAAFADAAPPVETPIVDETIVQETAVDETVVEAPPVAESRTEASAERAPAAQPTDAGLKVFVCKYVGTPGVDEEFQTGNNPISVDFKEGMVIGDYFVDGQGRSYILEFDDTTGGGQEGEPSIDDCPAPDGGPEEVTPSASVAQIDCLDEELVGGVITVDLTKMGVTYTIEDSEGDPVAFDETTGATAMLEPGVYTVYGADADSEDGYDASNYEEEFIIDEFTDECGEDELTPVTPAADATQIDCPDEQLTGGVITVDLTKMGVLYTIEDSEGDPVSFDPTTGDTGMLEPGVYTVFGVDGNSEDEYGVSNYEEEFTIAAFAGDCGELGAVVVFEVTAIDECVEVDDDFSFDFAPTALVPAASFTVTGSLNVSYSYTVNGGPSIPIVVADGERETISVTPGDTIVVTAAAAEGFLLPEGYEPFEQEFTNSEFCIELPPLANWPASATASNEVCQPNGLVSGAITVQLSTGPSDNLNPVRYYVAYGTPQQKELVDAVTSMAPGSYLVTAVATVPADSLNDAGNTAEFMVNVGAAVDEQCDELETLAFTGASAFTEWLGVAAVLMMVAGMGFVVRRNRVEV